MRVTVQKTTKLVQVEQIERTYALTDIPEDVARALFTLVAKTGNLSREAGFNIPTSVSFRDLYNRMADTGLTVFDEDVRANVVLPEVMEKGQRK